MTPILIAALIIVGLPVAYLAWKNRGLRKFLAGAFFVSGGLQFYFWLVKVPIPLYGTDIVQTPELSGVRSIIHFALFLVCLYTGFIKKTKPQNRLQKEKDIKR
jgi:hypothetical protein